MIYTEADRLFDEAIGLIESQSIRTWACSARNRPVWMKYIEGTLKAGIELDAIKLSTFMVITAMG